MNEHQVEEQPQQKTTTIHRPIWVPNPAVPLTARILAYVFGFLIIFTVVRSCTYNRPADEVTAPTAWRAYRCKQGQMIPYPDGWGIDDRSAHNYTDVIFYLPPGGWVRMETVILQTDYTIEPYMVEQLNAKFEENLRKEYSDYSEQGADRLMSDWHLFQAKMADKDPRRRVTGAWATRVQVNRILLIVASAPSGSWRNMRDIMSHVETGATLY